jgi:hypothetical protein
MCVSLILVAAVLQGGALAGRVEVPARAGPAIRYGAGRLQNAMDAARSNLTVVISEPGGLSSPEGFTINFAPRGAVLSGGDDAGLLYGALELAERIRNGERLTDMADAPAMAERISQIAFTPGRWGTWRRSTPVAPPYFEWFYNRALWVRVLDNLAENRINGLCIWTQHVFSSFVSLPEFPEDLEVNGAQLAANRAQLRWLGEEAARRNIRIIWQTYVITLSRKFEAAHRAELSGAGGLVLAQRYTAAWIEQFLTDYPDMRLMITPAEDGFQPAAVGTHGGLRAGVLRDMVFPALSRIRDRSGESPALYLRIYGLNMDATVREIIPFYKPLITMWKYTSETYASLAPYPSHAPALAVSPAHIANIHTVQNLKPFRWASPEFVRASCRHMLKQGFRGVHFYSQWYDWPYSGDRVAPKLLQIDRDWMWFAMWGRYTWNPDRPKDDEELYWSNRIAERFGMPAASARRMLQAYESAGWIAPNLTREFWLGGEVGEDIWKYDGPGTLIKGNAGGDYHIWAAGARLDQMVYAPGIHSCGTDGVWRPMPEPLLTIRRMADQMAHGETISGRTPLMVADEEREHARVALGAARAAAPSATSGRAELERILADMQMIAWMADFYAAKAEAALWQRVWVAKRSSGKNDPAAGGRCLEALRRSLNTYRQLAEAGDRAYFAFTDFPRPYPYRVLSAWADVLPKFEAELESVEAGLARTGN